MRTQFTTYSTWPPFPFLIPYPPTHTSLSLSHPNPVAVAVAVTSTVLRHSALLCSALLRPADQVNGPRTS